MDENKEPGFDKSWTDRAEDFERKLREQVGEIDQSIREKLKDFVPPDVKTHLKNTKREFLLAVRGFIDRELDRDEPEKNEKE
jgi:hypothetical protein